MLLVVLGLCSHHQSGVDAFRQEPSDSVRQGIRTAIADEDVMVMQAEMAWGATEMKRYKTLRGDWPTRSALASEEQAETNSRGIPTSSSSSSEGGLFRGGRGATSGDYWNYLVSMF